MTRPVNLSIVSTLTGCNLSRNGEQNVWVLKLCGQIKFRFLRHRLFTRCLFPLSITFVYVGGREFWPRAYLFFSFPKFFHPSLLFVPLWSRRTQEQRGQINMDMLVNDTKPSVSLCCFCSDKRAKQKKTLICSVSMVTQASGRMLPPPTAFWFLCDVCRNIPR